ncbi:VOC family protein [Galbibacter sp. BG1]|uniref:VOC family protein n=1 Tax=Galbibacter sp. BG1 TaxID=1170699 RepID=UPI0015C0326E|nr:VOC family protein [Galbibacter sp. BG1]QLE00419.1 VOC family protein [Galbibacter sp. BG1]
MKIQAYLAFKNQCEEALNFYKGIFGGEVVNKQTYEDKNMDIPESYRHNLQHAELKGKGFHFMAYDASPDTPITSGSNMYMSIDATSKEEAEDIFKKLSGGGSVHQPFEKSSWGDYFGRCTDKYNIQWMVNAKE